MSPFKAYYLDQLGISAWTLRKRTETGLCVPSPDVGIKEIIEASPTSIPSSRVLMIVDGIETDLKSWLLGVEGRLLKKIVSCIDLSWDQIIIEKNMINASDDSPIDRNFPSQPDVIVFLGNESSSNQWIEDLQVKYPSIPMIKTFSPKSLLNNPVNKRKTYVDFQQIQQFMELQS